MSAILDSIAFSLPGRPSGAGPEPITDTTDFDDLCSFARERLYEGQYLRRDDLAAQRKLQMEALDWAILRATEAKAMLEAER